MLKYSWDGCIFLDLAKPLDENAFMGKSYANIAVITGHINTGAVVTLSNKKTKNSKPLLIIARW